MAKKKMSPENTTENTRTRPATPARRRAPAKKKTAPVTAASTGNGRQPTQAEIAEAAYFRHLNRGGNHGDEFSDWVEAERELKGR
jgi:hypothetical protein